jgi:uncharacterized membrane protein
MLSALLILVSWYVCVNLILVIMFVQALENLWVHHRALVTIRLQTLITHHKAFHGDGYTFYDLVINYAMYD